MMIEVAKSIKLICEDIIASNEQEKDNIDKLIAIRTMVDVAIASAKEENNKTKKGKVLLE